MLARPEERAAMLLQKARARGRHCGMEQAGVMTPGDHQRYKEYCQVRKKRGAHPFFAELSQNLSSGHGSTCGPSA
eukprot:13887660-Alexandrium_andersonii.AAC.1